MITLKLRVISHILPSHDYYDIERVYLNNAKSIIEDMSGNR